MKLSLKQRIDRSELLYTLLKQILIFLFVPSRTLKHVYDSLIDITFATKKKMMLMKMCLTVSVHQRSNIQKCTRTSV